jgi:nucleoside 2-deoxyribosyltransferase
MNAATTDWSSDRRLDILVLGPMGDAGNEPPTIKIRNALNAILLEPDFQALLTRHRILTPKVHVPEGQTQPEIVQNILGLLDSADLAVFDLTPGTKNADRANVFYELALVHSLGIPALLVIQEGYDVPFYARTTTQYRVPNFDPSTLANALRAPLREFLDLENRTTSFTNDRISQFYGLPIVDISAAVGLATGYYYNFLSRLITEGGFLSHHPDKIKHVLYVRPSSVNGTYEADMTALKAALQAEGHQLKTGEKLDALRSDDKGPLWFDHVNGIVLDIPRTIYPLRRSPRLLSMHQRNQNLPSVGAERSFFQRMHQIEEDLLARVEAAIRFQIRHDGPRVRSQILHFTTITDAPALVKSLSV